jgi:Domain of unknown function (DUF4157)
MFGPPVKTTKVRTASDIAATRAKNTPGRMPWGPSLVGAGQVSMLPRTIGNQATLGLLSQWARSPAQGEQEADRMRTLAPKAAPGVSWDFSKAPVFPPDRAGRLEGQSSPLLAMETPAIAEAIHQATAENHAAAPPTQAALPLDLARVRIRDDASADRSARLLGAQALAFGDQILFRRGRYEPNTERGRALIAHELTHVADQSRTGRPNPQRFVARDILSVQFTQAMAEAMSDDELSQQMQLLRAHLQSEPEDAGAAENLTLLEKVAFVRQGTAQETPGPGGAPQEAAKPASAGADVASGPSSTTPKAGLTTGEKVLIGVLIGAAVVGGVALIVLSGGTAAPAIIVGLEAAGDVAVGTELAAGTAVVGEAVVGGETAAAAFTEVATATTKLRPLRRKPQPQRRRLRPQPHKKG